MITERENIKMLGRVDELNRLLEGKEFKIAVTNKFKNNSSKIGYALTSDKSNAARIVFYEHLIQYWNSNEEIISYLEKIYDEYKSEYMSIEKYCSREYILAHVRPRLVSSDNLPEIQKQGIVYEEFLDMLVLYYVEIAELSNDEGLATAIIGDSILYRERISMKELKEQAQERLKEDYEIILMQDIINEMSCGAFEYEKELLPMFVLTNSKKTNGAAVILNKDILEETSKKFDNGEFGIIPSSIHECIAVPAEEQCLKEFKKMVYEVNSTDLHPEDILTNSIYLYRNGELTIY